MKNTAAPTFGQNPGQAESGSSLAGQEGIVYGLMDLEDIERQGRKIREIL